MYTTVNLHSSKFDCLQKSTMARRDQPAEQNTTLHAYCPYTSRAEEPEAREGEAGESEAEDSGAGESGGGKHEIYDTHLLLGTTMGTTMGTILGTTKYAALGPSARNDRQIRPNSGQTSPAPKGLSRESPEEDGCPNTQTHMFLGSAMSTGRSSAASGSEAAAFMMVQDMGSPACLASTCTNERGRAKEEEGELFGDLVLI